MTVNSSAILTVGVGKEYSTIAAAVAASGNGDTIQVDAGTYTNDFADITNQITLVSVGGVVNMVATELLPNKKGILIVDNNATIKGFSFSGAAISAGDGNNGAAIRYQSGNLTLIDDNFTHNQDGLLATPAIAGTGTIDIENSEFSANGAGDGYSHNIYVGDVASFTFNQSYSHDAIVGHDIKSRAEVTTITNSRIEDGSGSASYSIDLPNGGVAVISDDIIQQGTNSQNPSIIAYGEEGNLHANSSLTVANNTIVNDLTAHAPTGVWNPANAPVTMSNNKVFGLTSANLTSGTATVSGTTWLGGRPNLDLASTWQSPLPIVPAPTIVGSGPDKLTFMMSEDAYQGDAQFKIALDGVQLGATETAKALHAVMQTQAFDLEGSFGAGQHTLSVSFLNDRYAGTATLDRNLYVDSVVADGKTVIGTTVSLFTTSTRTFTFQLP